MSEPEAATSSATNNDQEVQNVTQAVSNLNVEEPKIAEDEDGENDTKEPQENTALLDGLDPNDINADVAVRMADPNSPYQAAETFEDLKLPEPLLRGVYELKFSRPSRIQANALPLIMREPYANLIGQAHNGSGKTATFVLAMLSRVNPQDPNPQAVCLCPTRELAIQTLEVVQTLGKFMDVKTVLVSAQTELPTGNVPMHVIIATPGRLVDLLKRRVINASNVQMLVLDEADSMLDAQGFLDSSMRIKQYLPRKIQVLLFSATFADKVRKFAEQFAPRANKIVIKKENLTLKNVKQVFVDCQNEQAKYDVLKSILDLLQTGQIVIFVQRRDTSDALTRRLRAEKYAVSVIHSQMDNEARKTVIDEFRTGTTKILIATNLIARGIDVPAVSLVVNFDLPVDRQGHPDPETYLHRIGRAGRFGRKGVAVSFIHDHKSRQVLQEIEKYYQHSIDTVPANDIARLFALLEE